MRQGGTHNSHALLRIHHFHRVERDVPHKVVVSPSHGTNGDAMPSAAVALFEQDICCRVDRDAVILVPDLRTCDDNIITVVDIKRYVALVSAFVLLDVQQLQRATSRGTNRLCCVQGCHHRHNQPDCNCRLSLWLQQPYC